MAVDIERQRRLGEILLDLRDLGATCTADLVAVEARADVPACTNPPIDTRGSR